MRSSKAGGRSEQSERPPAEVARDICLRHLAVRPRTRAELATVLRRNGVAPEVAAEVLDRYDDVGIIDDEAFARAWVTSRHHGRGLARRALAGELRRKGVDDAAVGEALDELDDATEEATARVLVERRLRLERRDRPEATLRRLVGMLARKGYPPGLAVRVVRDALAADEVSAEFAGALDPDALADAMVDPDDETPSER
jgi:regulatory protein